MIIEVEKGQLRINIHALLDNMTDEERLDLIDTLSCSDVVIKHVADQIITGYTDYGSCGWKGHTESPYTPLDKATRQVAENSSEIAKEEIQDLMRMIKSRDKTIKELGKQCDHWKMVTQRLKEGIR